MHNLHTEETSCTTLQSKPRNTYLAITLAKKMFFSSATQVKPCRAGLGIGWVTHREYRREGPYFVLSFLSLLFLASNNYDTVQEGISFSYIVSPCCSEKCPG